MYRKKFCWVLWAGKSWCWWCCWIVSHLSLLMATQPKIPDDIDHCRFSTELYYTTHSNSKLKVIAIIRTEDSRKSTRCEGEGSPSAKDHASSSCSSMLQWSIKGSWSSTQRLWNRIRWFVMVINSTRRQRASLWDSPGTSPERETSSGLRFTRFHVIGGGSEQEANASSCARQQVGPS